MGNHTSCYQPHSQDRPVYDIPATPVVVGLVGRFCPGTLAVDLKICHALSPYVPLSGKACVPLPLHSFLPSFPTKSTMSVYVRSQLFSAIYNPDNLLSLISTSAVACLHLDCPSDRPISLTLSCPIPGGCLSCPLLLHPSDNICADFVLAADWFACGGADIADTDILRRPFCKHGCGSSLEPASSLLPAASSSSTINGNDSIDPLLRHRQRRASLRVVSPSACRKRTGAVPCCYFRMHFLTSFSVPTIVDNTFGLHLSMLHGSHTDHTRIVHGLYIKSYTLGSALSAASSRSSSPHAHCRLSVVDTVNRLFYLNKGDVLSLASFHSLHYSTKRPLPDVRNDVLLHVCSGECNCRAPAALRTPPPSDSATLATAIARAHIALLESICSNINAKPAAALLQLYDIEHDDCSSVGQLRRRLKAHIKTLRKGKQVPRSRSDRRNDNYRDAQRQLSDAFENTRQQWPQSVSSSLKDKLIRDFRDATSSHSLLSFTCASCAESCLQSREHRVNASNLPMHLLRNDESTSSLMSNLPSACRPPMPFTTGMLKDIFLDPAGVDVSDATDPTLKLCPSCYFPLTHKKLPSLALANKLFLGPVPHELKDLTAIEESMIARCRAKSCIVHLGEDRRGVMPNAQRGLKGHVIIYPQRPDKLLQLLPPSVEEIVKPICILFVGSGSPSPEWIRTKAKPLAVRRDKVHNALLWLQKHNSLYRDISISQEHLDALPTDGSLPVHVEYIRSSVATESLTSRYDASSVQNSNAPDDAAHSDDIAFENVVITDVDARAPSSELRAAAMRHVKDKGRSFIQVGHEPQPVNEFCNPDLFPMIYPSLFPYGIAGFEDQSRTHTVSFKRQITHCFRLADRRFQEHFSFMFTAFNILQRRASLLHSSLKVKTSAFPSVARDFASITPDALQRVTDRVSHGDCVTAHGAEERRVLKLMREVKLVTSHVPGSSSSKLTMRNQIRALMAEKGQPSFYVTINPADVYNPLVKFLAGSDIDIDNMAPSDVPNYWEQSLLVARNPIVAARFFNLYMKAFIRCLLRYDPKHQDTDGGILGVVRSYYGCVEAQGRGTLHCHMMIWVEGGLNPTELKAKCLSDPDFRTRLLSFLDDTISNAVPPKPSALDAHGLHANPCAHRGVPLAMSGEDLRLAQEHDIHALVSQCQVHQHTHTCYKYWKGPPEPRECRFDLDEGNVEPQSYMNEDTGELCLRCLDGLVNNFNATILTAMRCNMDIQFVTSGASAKAILHYITDYITKSELKAHIAYAALERAVVSLGRTEVDTDHDEFTYHAKRMLQR
ncbi:hypothetical protein EVG20_g11068, partial [Dentipellis fragilis]